MRIRELHIRSFRGFSELKVRPNGHVVVMGEPRAGRSDLVTALGRVLDSSAYPIRSITELDFHHCNTGDPILIGLTLGNLGADIEQEFLDYLELWDKDEAELIDETDSPEALDEDQNELVLRLAYHCEWQAGEERFDDWVYYPKFSDPSTNTYARARRSDIRKLGYSSLNRSGERILDLAPRSRFQRVMSSAPGDDFEAALQRYVQDVDTAADHFGTSTQVDSAIENVLSPIRGLLGLASGSASQSVQFSPEGSSVSGLLRSLGAAIDMNDGRGSLPSRSQGSTVHSLIRIAEAMALTVDNQSIIAVDDLGDGMDPASAAHIAAALRSGAGQIWATTRTPAVAEMFEPEEIVRLGTDGTGRPIAIAGKRPSSKAEAVALKHWHRSLLPALSYGAVVIVEGPGDFFALHTLALRLFREQGRPLPATHRVALVNAGAMGDGGYVSVLKLAKEAKDMGLRVVGAVDGDSQQHAIQYVRSNTDMAHAVVRLTEGNAIEAAIIDGVQEDSLRQALSDISAGANLVVPQNLDQLSRSQLRSEAIRFVKRNFLHGQLIDALPEGEFPPLACEYLEKLIEVATGTHTGLIQL